MIVHSNCSLSGNVKVKCVTCHNEDYRFTVLEIQQLKNNQI